MITMQCNPSRQNGAILVEFLLITPLLLAIAGGAIEVARFLRFNQMASVFSQEAAITAYRRCTDIFVFNSNDTFDQTSTEAAIQVCLDTFRNGFQTQLNALSPNVGNNPQFSVILSVYRRDQVTDGDVATGFTSLTRIVSSPTGVTSHYSAAGEEIRRTTPADTVVLTDTQVRDMERIAIAEVGYAYSPAIQIYRVLLGPIDLLRTTGEFRETTIL
jgi:Flp pilus assembly protein TadG